MKVKLTKSREVFDYCEPYIIAEIGSNHNGDVALAKKMIVKAKEAGADCVKFQSWTKDTIFSKKAYAENSFLKDDYKHRTDFTLEEIVEKFQVTEEMLAELKKCADKAGIDFASTPFSKREADFLVDDLKAGFIKVASMDLNNYPFLSYLARKARPVVISTGMGTMKELDEAIKTIEAAGNKKIIILHCVSLYPPDDPQVNLNNMDMLRKRYSYPVGFSDHTLGTAIPLAAAAKGACIIEKHFTLDKKMFGWDHKISADFDELKTIAAESKRVNAALGMGDKAVTEGAERIKAFRRSIVAARDIRKGERFTDCMLDFKRPGDGIEPGKVKSIIGKTAKRDIGYDEMITTKDY